MSGELARVSESVRESGCPDNELVRESGCPESELVRESGWPESELERESGWPEIELERESGWPSMPDCCCCTGGHNFRGDTRKNVFSTLKRAERVAGSQHRMKGKVLSCRDVGMKIADVFKNGKYWRCRVVGVYDLPAAPGAAAS